MGKRLAIKGHPTRGKEVIELLKMLGGKGSESFHCSDLNRFYYISYYESISWDYIGSEEIDEYHIFTLEEFLEKFPFKVGDFVRIPEYESEVRICKMKWTSFSDIDYLVYRNDDEEWYTTDELLEYNDNPTKTRDCKKCGLHFGSVRCFDKDCPHNTPKPKSYAVGLKDGKVIECGVNKKTDMNKNNREVINMTKETITPTPDITANVIDKNNCDIACPDGYEFYDENGNLIGNKVMMRPKKPKYPTSYNDCCDILGFKNRNKTKEQFVNSCDLYDAELMTKLSMLKVCRDAYWKIAGEELQLGKPWRPKFGKYIHYNINFYLYKDSFVLHKGEYHSPDNRILVFPTEEMRDAFYENFKDLIEYCKELL
jgi:hypothetical protein